MGAKSANVGSQVGSASKSKGNWKEISQSKLKQVATFTSKKKCGGVDHTDHPMPYILCNLPGPR